MNDNNQKQVVLTRFCGWEHRASDGAPIGHKCCILPPEALEAERCGDFVGAQVILGAALPLIRHRGVKQCRF